MVKKSRFLDKIKDRMRTGGVRVESGPEVQSRATPSAKPEAGQSAKPEAGTNRFASGDAVKPGAGSKPAGARKHDEPKSEPHTPQGQARQVDAIARRAAEVKATRKLSPKEDASLAMRDGFQELGSLLRGMQSRIDNQGEQIARTVESVNQLPAIGQQQLETLRRLADRFDRQSEQTAVLARSLGDLPQTLKAVQASLDRAAAVDERQAKSLDEFRSNMSRIHESMEKMVGHSKAQSEATQSIAQAEQKALSETRDSLSQTFKGFEKSHKSATDDAAARLGAAHDRGVKALTKMQEQQAKQLLQLAESGTKSNRQVVVLLSLVFVALVVVAVLLATA